MTTEQLFKKYSTLQEFVYEGYLEYLVNKEDFMEAMIEFAKYHVENALKKASEKAEIEWDGLPGIGEFQCVNKESILNSYPLDNIV